MIVYLNGKYSKQNETFVSINDRAYVLGDGVYEGLRIYDGKIFKKSEHKQRFQRSLDALKINYKLEHEIDEIYQALFEKNSYKKSDELFMYIQITRGEAPRTHHFPSSDTKVGIYAFLCVKEINIKDYEDGIRVCTLSDNRWARCDIKAISLLANCLANQSAKEKNCKEALFVHDSIVTEGTHTNVFFVKNKTVYTHAITNRILAGVTRNVVTKLCLENNIKLCEFPLSQDELGNIDEAFLTGTTAEITPIISIDNNSVFNAKPGSITKRLQVLFKEEIKKGS